MNKHRLSLLANRRESRETDHTAAPEDCSTSIDMPMAMQLQTRMPFKYEGQTLPRSYGFPMKIRIPTKLGFQNPKFVTEMYVTND